MTDPSPTEVDRVGRLDPTSGHRKEHPPVNVRTDPVFLTCSVSEPLTLGTSEDLLVVRMDPLSGCHHYRQGGRGDSPSVSFLFRPYSGRREVTEETNGRGVGFSVQTTGERGPCCRWEGVSEWTGSGSSTGGWTPVRV